MKKEAGLLIEKAKRSLKAAEALFKRNDHDFATARAYYAMFYVASAVLLEKDKTYSKHAGVISGFYQNLIKTGEIPQEFHQMLHEAFEDRNQGDYSFLDPFSKKQAHKQLKNAKLFVDRMIQWFNNR